MSRGSVDPKIMSILAARVIDTLRAGWQTTTIGPFLAALHPVLDNPWMSYAVPAQAVEAQAFRGAMPRLLEHFHARNRPLRLEFMAELFEPLPAVLEEAGLRQYMNAPVMICDQPMASAGQPQWSIELLDASSTDEAVAQFIGIGHAAFGQARLDARAPPLGRPVGPQARAPSGQKPRDHADAREECADPRGHRRNRSPEAENPLGPGAQQVSIFLSIFDVHVNRAPIAGRVARVDYSRGEFLPAFDDKASLRNEQNSVLLEQEGGARVAFKQIAGLIARRIVFRKRVGDSVQRGERVGMIKFGSRVDVFVTGSASLRVRLGDRVRGGESVIAELP